MPALDIAGLLFTSRPSMEFRGAPLAIPLDAVLDRTHSYTSRVTSAPVEDRASVSDHVILEPKRLSVHGFVSDHAVSISGALSDLAADVESLFGQGATATRSQQAMNALTAAWKARALLTVVTKMATYDNMVIEKLDVTETAENVEALNFSADLREVQRISLVKTVLGGRFPADPTVDAAAGTVDRGRKPPTKAPASAKASARTLAETRERIRT